MRTAWLEGSGRPIFVTDADYHEMVNVPRTKPGCRQNEETRRDITSGNCFWGHDPSWYGGIRSVEDALKLMRGGWQEGADKAMKLVEKLNRDVPPPVSIKRKPRWRDDGDDLGVDRWLGGEQEYWRRAVREPREQPRTITLGVNFGGLASVTADQMFWCGAAACALADRLESAGYGCEIYAIHGSNFGSWQALSHIRVKGAGEPLRVDNLAVITAHAGYYRTIDFMMQEVSPMPVGYGRGSTTQAEPILRRAEGLGVFDDTIEAIIPLCYSEQQAIAAVEKAMGALAIDQAAL